MGNILNFVYNYPDTSLEQVFLCFITFFFCVLFIQSGFDKVLNRQANLSFLKSHFKKTAFQNYVSVLFVILAFLECFTGLIFCIVLIGIGILGFSHQIMSILVLGIILSNFTICCLFLGQRIANDYEGASNLTIYFLVALLSLFFVV